MKKKYFNLFIFKLVAIVSIVLAGHDANALGDCGVGYETLSNMSSVAGISSERSDNVWSVVFPYGTISGTSACLDVKKTKKGTTDETINVEGGTSIGQYCWGQADGGVCADDCASYCANDVRYYSDFRSAVFGVSNN